MKVQEEIIKIQNKGLVTIPKSYRDDLGLEENGLIRMKKEKGRIILEPVRILPYQVRSYSEAEVKAFIEEDKKQSNTLKKQKLI